jgi:hypothetical protein
VKTVKLRTAPPPTPQDDLRTRRIALVNGLKGPKNFHESNNVFDRVTAGLKEDDVEAYVLAYISAVDSELKNHNTTLTVLGGQMRGMMGGYGR